MADTNPTKLITQPQGSIDSKPLSEGSFWSRFHHNLQKRCLFGICSAALKESLRWIRLAFLPLQTACKIENDDVKALVFPYSLAK